jgi:hypothetical protein
MHLFLSFSLILKLSVTFATTDDLNLQREVRLKVRPERGGYTPERTIPWTRASSSLRPPCPPGPADDWRARDDGLNERDEAYQQDGGNSQSQAHDGPGQPGHDHPADTMTRETTYFCFCFFKPNHFFFFVFSRLTIQKSSLTDSTFLFCSFQKSPK